MVKKTKLNITNASRKKNFFIIKYNNSTFPNGKENKKTESETWAYAMYILFISYFLIYFLAIS